MSAKILRSICTNNEMKVHCTSPSASASILQHQLFHNCVPSDECFFSYTQCIYIEMCDITVFNRMITWEVECVHSEP